MNNIGSAIGALTQANVIPAPVPPDYIRSLEAAVCAQLPKDYSLLLERFGAIDIPADVPIAVYDPAVICGYVASIYNMDGTIRSKWPALPIAKYDRFGDDIGYLRDGDQFGPSLVILDHEGPWTVENDYWHKPFANSFADLVADRYSA